VVIGFDYTERIDPKALLAAGCRVVFRYLSRPGWPKNLTKAEADGLLAAGIAIVLNYETSATFMLGGYGAGQACARSARAQAAALGAPATARIYYSADFDATAAQASIVMAFLQGAASVDGADEVDAYGGLRIAQAAGAAGMRPWQTVAWSGGRWDPRDVARQTGEQRVVGGVRVDVNEIADEDFGALGAWIGGDMELTDEVPVSAGFAQRYPDAVPDGFAANARISVETLLLGGAIRAANNEHLLAKLAADIEALTARVAQPPAIDVKALAAALAPLLAKGASADQIASAVVSHLGAAIIAGSSSTLAENLSGLIRSGQLTAGGV
jgi:hypothetical protein